MAEIAGPQIGLAIAGIISPIEIDASKCEIAQMQLINMKKIRHTTLEAGEGPNGTQRITVNGEAILFPPGFGQQIALTILQDFARRMDDGPNSATDDGNS